VTRIDQSSSKSFKNDWWLWWHDKQPVKVLKKLNDLDLDFEIFQEVKQHEENAAIGAPENNRTQEVCMSSNTHNHCTTEVGVFEIYIMLP